MLMVWWLLKVDSSKVTVVCKNSPKADLASRLLWDTWAWWAYVILAKNAHRIFEENRFSDIHQAQALTMHLDLEDKKIKR